jgi:plastocyanin
MKENMRHLVRPLTCGAVGLVFTAGLLSGCTKKSENAVQVTGTDTECTAAGGSIQAGKVTFELQNKAGDVNELYVLTPDGEVRGEVENVATGSMKSLTADLTKGEYVLRCKPGMTGNGIESRITVVGDGGTKRKAADRTVAISAHEYGVDGVPTDVKAGETIRFEMHNTGKEIHEFEVLDPAGETVGEVGPTEGGATGIGTVTFEKAGTYKWQCILVNGQGQAHDALGMHGTITVA